jgi:hypothetical protein
MVCSTEREGKRFPFDIQHRTINEYKVDAPDDFDKLRTTITARIKASLDRGEAMRRLGNIEQVAPVAGLTMEQLTVLAVSASAVGAPDSTAALYSIQQDAERASLTKLGVALGLRGLMTKGFLQRVREEDFDGSTYNAITVTDRGWNWIEQNRSRFYLRSGECQLPTQQPTVAGSPSENDASSRPETGAPPDSANLKQQRRGQGRLSFSRHKTLA